MEDFRTSPDYDEAARILGVARFTLPTGFPSKAEPELPSGQKVAPLSDEEWEALSGVLPGLPVPKPNADFKDRTFINAVLWWIDAKARGYSWYRLPPELGPQASREGRHRRWCLLGYWRDIADAVANDERFSPARRIAFQRVADDATNRKTAILKSRARLIDAS